MSKIDDIIDVLRESVDSEEKAVNRDRKLRDLIGGEVDEETLEQLKKDLLNAQLAASIYANDPMAKEVIKNILEKYKIELND